jgi:hypothetical protein
MRQASSSCLPWVILRTEVGASASSRPNPARRRQGSLFLPLRSPVFLCLLGVKSFDCLSQAQIDRTAIFTTSSTCITSLTINPSAYRAPINRP